MTLARPYRWFFLSALGINLLCFALVRLIPRPQVGIGAAVDVAVTVPALYFLLIVRSGLAPAVSVIPLCLLGLLRATYLAQGIAFTRPLVSAAAEVAVLWLLISRVRRGLRASDSTDLLERIEQAAREIFPSRRAAAVLAGELAVFWYAFASWRRQPDVPGGARAFTIHRESGVGQIFGFLAGVSLMEAALVHLMVARWSALAAWILTAASVYGAIWLAAVARSFSLRPVLLTDEELVVRAGLLWTVRIPRRLLAVESAGARPDLKIPMLAEPNLILRVSEPVTAHGIYGMTRRVQTLALGLDDAAAFRSVLH